MTTVKIKMMIPTPINCGVPCGFRNAAAMFRIGSNTKMLITASARDGTMDATRKLLPSFSR